MNNLTIFLILFFPFYAFSQNTPEKISFFGAQSIVLDSKDNVFVGITDKVVKITPDGKATMFLNGWKNFIKNVTTHNDFMTIDVNDNIYVIGLRENIVRKITPDGRISKLAGQDYTYRVVDGPIATANFRSLEYITIDRKGNLYVLDADDPVPLEDGHNISYKTYVIRRISTDGIVSTITDEGTNKKIWVNVPEGLAADSAGNLYVSYSLDRCIKKITLLPDGKGTVTTVAGMCGKREFHPRFIPGDISKAELFTPADIVFNKKGELFFADTRLHRIIKIANNQVSTLAGNSVIQPDNLNMGGSATEGFKDGPALKALFNFPLGVAIDFDSKGNLFILDGGNYCIRKLSTDGIVTTFAK